MASPIPLSYFLYANDRYNSSEKKKSVLVRPVEEDAKKPMLPFLSINAKFSLVLVFPGSCMSPE